MLPWNITAAFFKSVEARSNNLKQFIKWRATLKRYLAELNSDKKMICTSKGHNINSYGDWKIFNQNQKNMRSSGKSA